MNNFRKQDMIWGWLAFAGAALVYLLTIEPTTSLWDCPEFIATSHSLQVGHPPGSPFFMMVARLFTLLAPAPQYAARMVNSMSALCSAFAVLFLFWTITHLGRRLLEKQNRELTPSRTLAVMGAGMIGAIAYTFTDTFWFSAVEGEVYAFSSLFTAIVVWAMLKWEESADQPHSSRWLVFIAYMMGLSTGVHILNLLCIPALAFIYYFKKTPKVTKWGFVKAMLAGGGILVAVNYIIIPYSVIIGALFDRIFVNGFGAPVNSGITVYVFLLFGLCAWGIWYTYKNRKVVANTIILCTTMIILGYGSYTATVIRAAVNPPMNSNNPSNPYALLSLLSRDQYGDRPLLFGPAYSSPAIGVKNKTIWFLDQDSSRGPVRNFYNSTSVMSGVIYPPEFTFFFPRMYSSRDDHPKAYESWGRVTGDRQIPFDDGSGDAKMIAVPTMGNNLTYFFSYQLNFMYWRYFLWNFAGRQSDVQSTGEITDGNWLSGVKFIDRLYLGPQDKIPSEMAANKGRNTYFFLPFILGIIGLIYQLNRDKRNFTVVMWLFFMMGIALVLYFNTTPGEPRERDYVFAGSFYAFCIWIGFGVMWLYEKLSLLAKRENAAIAVVSIAVCSVVPILLGTQNWDDHDRSRRYTTRDLGWNYLQSAIPNAIVMNFGDNDTFPLWYNQETEGVRRDIRVMNMSYLGADWYIDEMRRQIREQAPVPFSLPRSKYVNTNDYIYVNDIVGGKPLNIKTAIEYIASDDPRTMITLSSGTSVDFLPAKTLALPVDKANAIASGIVARKDAALMADTVYLNIKKSSIDKSEMMLLDLLANFDWKRPLYFTQTYSIASLGLRDYLQFDGYAYRFVPIKTPYENPLNVGRVDTDYLYGKLMNEFRFGNIADPRVYADYFIQTNHNAAQSRNGYARLASALVERGEKEQAVAVLDSCVKWIPFNQIRHSYILTIPVIEAYYKAGAVEKGDAIMSDYQRILEEYVLYYRRFTGRQGELVRDALQEKLSYLGALYNSAKIYNRQAKMKEIDAFFNSIGL